MWLHAAITVQFSSVLFYIRLRPGTAIGCGITACAAPFAMPDCTGMGVMSPAVKMMGASVKGPLATQVHRCTHSSTDTLSAMQLVRAVGTEGAWAAWEAGWWLLQQWTP